MIKNMDVEYTNDQFEMETVTVENGDSSNEGTEDEAEEGGQQDREEADTIMPEVDEPEKEHLSEVQKKYSEEEMRILNELRQLTPPVLAAEVDRLEKVLYELSQREAREITRSKHLDNSGKNKRRSNK